MAMAQFTWAILMVAAVVQCAMPAEGMIDIEQNVQRVPGSQLCRSREGTGRTKCFQPLAFMNVLGKSMLVQVLITLIFTIITLLHSPTSQVRCTIQMKNQLCTQSTSTQRLSTKARTHTHTYQY